MILRMSIVATAITLVVAARPALALDRGARNKPPAGSAMKIIGSIAKAAAVLRICGRSAVAAPEEQALREMDHTMWTARDGAPQAIRALAQDPDGTLWIGSENGLVNFDGQRFRLFESPPGDPLFPAARVESLLIAKDGTVWVGLFQAGAARIKAGRVTVYDDSDRERLGLALYLCQARDGSWAVANSQQLIRFDRDRTWHREEQPLSTRIAGIFIDASNTLWVAQGGLLYRRSLGQRSYTRTNVPASLTHGFAPNAGRTHLDDGHRRGDRSWQDATDRPSGQRCLAAAVHGAPDRSGLHVLRLADRADA